MNNAGLKEHLAQIFINSAELTEYEQQDGSRSKCLLVKIPYRSINAFHKVNEKVVSHLEAKFNWPVIVVATRTIVSKRGKQLFLSHSAEVTCVCSYKTQNSKETQKQNSHCSLRSHFGRYRKYYLL
jgi:hypothetical protein